MPDKSDKYETGTSKEMISRAAERIYGQRWFDTFEKDKDLQLPNGEKPLSACPGEKQPVSRFTYTTSPRCIQSMYLL